MPIGTKVFDWMSFEEWNVTDAYVLIYNGEIIGKLEVSSQHKIKTIRKDHLAEAWSILTGVKEHTTKWIEEKKTWSKVGLLESLS